ncbi:hypothetical protein DSL72_005465 [Monilinia vaccinii-corymbosi]|uniref:Zn(2)-C6 fungal-type domain-containing protein n=1 Tax=Monilinia vaccinii-corymbosi TaxID=61207 RepID=A0A8A3PFS9_9HELO|nr:hypothetical protein DSL72_005465 [Monilinia vaccinii-corymbosi]
MFLVLAPPPQVERNSVGEQVSIPLRKRRGLPKVHSGCTTCKARRIKCDEGKPECRRCTIFYKGTSQKCGYLTREFLKPHSKKVAPATGRNILPKNVGQPETFLGEPPRSISDVKFESPKHFQYFRFFCSDVTTQVFGRLFPELWNGVVLQACHHETCFLQAVCAIGALCKVMVARKQGRITTIHDDYRFAVQEYGKALGGMKKLIPIRMTLLASFLIFCFENFHGNHISAVTQIQSAANLLQEWMKERQKRQITDQSISPAPDVIEDAIFATFHSTHIGLVSAIDPTISQAPDIISRTRMYIPSLVPVMFTTIDYAAFNFTAISRQVIGFLMSTATLIRREQETTEEDAADAAESAIWNKRTLNWSPAQAEFKEIMDKLDQWQTAFEPLARRIAKEDADFVTICTMRTHWLTIRSSFHSAFNPYTPAYVYQPSFDEVVKICKTVVVHPSFEKGFVFYVGIIPSLTAAARLGAISTRKEAIKVLLEIVPRREGSWDAAVSARDAIAVMKMEYKKWKQDARGNSTIVGEA